jgi:hypothetical protein
MQFASFAVMGYKAFHGFTWRYNALHIAVVVRFCYHRTIPIMRFAAYYVSKFHYWLYTREASHSVCLHFRHLGRNVNKLLNNFLVGARSAPTTLLCPRFVTYSIYRSCKNSAFSHARPFFSTFLPI